MLPEILDTGLLACALPLAAGVFLFGIYTVIKTESSLGRAAQSAPVLELGLTAEPH